MKDLLHLNLVIFLLICFSFDGLAQEKSDWRVGFRAFTVSHGAFKQGNDFGGGFFLANQRKFSQRLQLKWNNEIGLDALLPCNRPEGCKSWWYERSIRYYSGLEKNLKLAGQDFSIGLGINFFYGNQMVARITVEEHPDFITNTYPKTITKFYEPVFSYFQPGARIGYSNEKINERIHFNLGYDWVWNIHMTSLSVSYKLKN